MNANELRIGNLINARFHMNNMVAPDFYWLPIKIKAIHEDYIHTAIGERIDFIDTLIKPIPLTEEWLLKLGFKKETTKHAEFYLIDLKRVSTLLKGLCLYFESSENEWQICFTDYYTGVEKTEFFPNPIHYVHELQNLYFALTGEELTNEN